MKIVKHIPNTITSMNLLCGVLGVIFTLQGRLDTAFYLMLAGAVCDFCDGFAARLLNAYSDMGKELDSLADLITFGFLPSIMLYKCMDLYHPGEWYCFLPLIIVVFSALRLAKFNIDERQTENFLGLATPACAMICGSFATISHLDINNIVGAFTVSTWMIPVGAAVLSLLLVSEIPMFSFKIKKGSPYNRIRIYFVGIVAAIAVATFALKINWSYIVLITLTVYVFLNILMTLFSPRKTE